MIKPFSRLSLPCSFRTRTAWCPICPDCEWVATTAPPRPSTNSAKARGVQVLRAVDGLPFGAPWSWEVWPPYSAR